MTFIQSVSAALYPYLSHPLFQVVIAGVLAPLIHRALKDRGLDMSPRATVLFNALLSSTPFLVLATSWGAKGVPAPEEFFTDLLAAFGASQLLYKLFLQREADGSIDSFSITSVPAGSDAVVQAQEDDVKVKVTPAAPVTVVDAQPTVQEASQAAQDQI